MPRVRGRRSRAPGARVASGRPRRTSSTSTQRRSIRSVTLPRLPNIRSSRRDLPALRTERPSGTTRRTIRPGTRTTTTTPSRMRTASAGPRRRSVVRRTRAPWSPGSVRAAGADTTTSEADRPGAIASRTGRTCSQGAAGRVPTLGRPRRSSANPARATSTTTGSAPVFATRIVSRPRPTSAIRDGEATSDTGGRAALAPVETGASAQAVIATQTIIARSACR